MRKVKTKELQEALSTAALFGATHSPVESFLSCRVKATKNGLTLLCGSSSGFCQTSVPSEGDDVFSAYVQTKKLRDVLANVRDEQVALSVKGSSLLLGIASGEVAIAAHSHTLELPTITDGEWVEVDSKQSASELDFLASVSSTPLIDCIKIQKGRSTIYTGTACSWVNNSKMLWASGTLLGLESCKLLKGLLAKSSSAQVLMDSGNLGVKWEGGVAIIRGVDHSGKVKTVPGSFFDSEMFPVCEVDRRELQRVASLCQCLSLVESIGVDVKIANGSVRLSKQTRETGAVDIALPCVSFSREYEWFVGADSILASVRSMNSDVVQILGAKTSIEEPDSLTMTFSDGERFVAIGSLDR